MKSTPEEAEEAHDDHDAQLQVFLYFKIFVFSHDETEGEELRTIGGMLMPYCQDLRVITGSHY